MVEEWLEMTADTQPRIAEMQNMSKQEATIFAQGH